MHWFLIVIYFVFISLGLPDSLLGAAWPAMRLDLGAELGAAGLIAMVVSSGTILSSMHSGRLIGRLGTGKLTLASNALTALALVGFSRADSLAWMLVMAALLGLGAGAVDAAMNHFVADNYEAHHMNWLHSFWGIGATFGPLVVAFFIAWQDSWRNGYLAVAGIQLVVVATLLATLAMWEKVASSRRGSREEESAAEAMGGDAANGAGVFRIPGVKHSLAAFFFCTGTEMTVGLWGASYLAEIGGMVSEAAAGWIAMYFGGITLGRVATGFIAMRLSNRRLILMGQLTALLGSVVFLLPMDMDIRKFSLLLIGLGLAPNFPGMVHETPRRFGKGNSARLIGYQMAAASLGATLLPPAFGLLANQVGIFLLPFVIFLFLLLLAVNSERIYSVMGKRP